MSKTTVKKTNTRRPAKKRSSVSAVRRKTVKKQYTLSLPRGLQLSLIVTQVKKPKPRAKAKKMTARAKKAHLLRIKRIQLALTSCLLLVGVVGTIFFGMRVLAAPVAAPVKPIVKTATVVTPPTNKSLPRSVPITLRAPDIELNTTLGTVGLAKDGSIQVPVNYMTAGWYDASPTPGQIGPSIIVGHLDNVKGLAVFWRLRELVPGQFIYIDRADGTTAKFIVNKLEQVSPTNYPTTEVYGNTKDAQLRLITCGGTFNRLTGHYDQNTVVFATLVQ